MLGFVQAITCILGSHKRTNCVYKQYVGGIRKSQLIDDLNGTVPTTDCQCLGEKELDSVEHKCEINF